MMFIVNHLIKKRYREERIPIGERSGKKRLDEEGFMQSEASGRKNNHLPSWS